MPARVDDRPDDLGQSQRQDIYLQALATIPTVEIHLGQFRTRKKPVPLAKRQADGSRKIVMALVTEEKGSDVSNGHDLGPRRATTRLAAGRGKPGPQKKPG